MTDRTRTYTKTRRAQLEADTRRRITESAVALHGTVGPSRTSMSAVAARAGVRRSTLYRHFPDEAALFEACTAHWIGDNPAPDIGRWARIEDPDARLVSALCDLYAFYQRGEPMLANVIRDSSLVPVVYRHLGAMREYLAAARRTLMRGRGAARRREVSAAIGHALSFATWHSLVREQGLDGRRAARLMAALVAAAQERPPPG